VIGPRARIGILLSLVGLILKFGDAGAQQTPPPAAQNPYLMGTEGYDQGPRGLTSYQPIAIDQPFAARMAQEVAAKPGIEREHQALLEERYDLGDHVAQGVTMEHGKPLQEGVRVKLPQGVTWEQLAAMTPDAIGVVCGNANASRCRRTYAGAPIGVGRTFRTFLKPMSKLSCRRAQPDPQWRFTARPLRRAGSQMGKSGSARNSR
jgi:hypothetical protein